MRQRYRCVPVHWRLHLVPLAALLGLGVVAVTLFVGQRDGLAATWWALLLALLGLALSVVLTTRLVFWPLQRLTAAAAQLERGDLTARTALLQHDELGLLGRT